MTEEVTTEVVEPTEEDKAREHGWVPQDEWKGNPDQWRPAKDFNDRGDMIGNLIREQKDNSTLRKEVNELKDSIRTLGEHNKRVAEQAKADALAELKTLKKEALKDGDVDTVVDVDDKIAEIRATEVQETNAPAPDPIVTDWLATNDWYEKDTALKASFDGLVNDVVTRHPEMKNNPSQVLDVATKMMKETFPERFGSKRTMQAVADPQEPAKRGGTKGKFKASDLSYEQRQVAERMISQGAGITLDTYAEQLGSLGEL